jgi:hypothetical protein
MNELAKSLPEIIKQAATSPLGILALMIIGLAILAFFFFRGASERTRLVIFVMLFFGVAAFGAVVMHQAAKPRLEDAHPENTPQKVDVLSTTRNKPTPLTSNEISGKGVGEDISYYCTFNAGPGEVKVTVDGKNKPGLLAIRPGEFSDAVAVEISDLNANRLLYIEMALATINEPKVERFQLGHRQQVIMRILLSKHTLDYMVQLGGQIDFSPTTKAQGPQ